MKEAPVQIHFPPELPVSQHVEQIRALLEKHQVLIVAGETGSGKTTQLPKLCLQMGRGQHGLIGHTQPRRLAARTVAARLAEELGPQAADRIAFQVRFADSTSERSMVKVMTDGILLAETRTDRDLKRYDTIIIDEAHERSLNIDFLLGYLKRLLPRRPDLKLVITSATLDVALFSRHFDGAPVIEVSGRTYPVEVRYRPPLESGGDGEGVDLGEQVLAAFNDIRQLERKHRPRFRDILVFLSGEREIRDVAASLRKQADPGLEILPLYARLSNKEQQRVFAPHAGRRIVLATNVAETSLTVPGIGYVIDSGTARISRYSVRSKIQRLPVEAVSRASANQRAGRCGRLGPGVCIRLYSEDDFNARPEFTDTEITRTNLASVILQMLYLGLGDIEHFPFVEAPDPRAVRDGLRILEELQAINARHRLTPTGRLMATLPVDPRLARVLVEASRLNCLREMLVITSALGIQDPRERPHDKQQAADQAHRQFYHPESDFCTWLSLWEQFEEQRQALGSAQLRKYCQQRFLSWMRMREWREVHRQLLLMCQDMKLGLNKAPAEYEAIHQALLSGFISQVAHKLDDGTYLGARSRKYVLFPGSTLHRKSPRWILSAELVETSQLFARMNARVDAQWIERQGAHLTKHEYFDPHWERKRGQVVGFEKVILYGLVVVEKRRRNYARVDAAACREIFIRQGLVPLAVNTRLDFYEHNRQLVEDLHRQEERSRRRDILVDDDQIHAFYDSRLGPDVIDMTSLERWYKRQSPGTQRTLFMTVDDLRQQDSQLVDEQAFPQQMDVSSMKLALDYVFDPGKSGDGVSVEVPVTALKQVREQDLDWMVPGLLREKCIALIKSLPRALRKNFIPVPDVVDSIRDRLDRADGSLEAALARQLLRLTGVQLPADAFASSRLPEHLQMNIRVIDDQGRVLGQGRDLAALKEEFSKVVQANISRAGESGIEQLGLKEWRFGTLAETASVRVDNLSVEAYPALLDREQHVDLVLLDTPYKAAKASIEGVARLLMLANRQQVRYLQKQILQDPTHLAAMSMLGGREVLIDQLIRKAYVIAFRLDDALPREKQAFEALQAGHKHEVVGVAGDLETLVCRILQQYKALQRRLKRGVGSPRDLVLREDVDRQLANLVHERFLDATPWRHMQQIPRYLEAVDSRLDKYASQADRDREWTRMLGGFWQQYSDLQALNRRQEREDEALDEFRWLIEELRVSLFAQVLGTRVPVSEKRLQRFWQDRVLGQ